MTEAEMVRWHHQLNGHVFEYVLGVGDGTGKHGLLQSMQLQTIRHNLVTELTELTEGHIPSSGTVGAYSFIPCIF